MFKNKGEFTIAMTEGRVFETADGWVMKFDPLREKIGESLFVCKKPGGDTWVEMCNCWDAYEAVKEIFPDLKAMKSCVINYLLGQKDISAELINEISALGDECFWIEGSDGQPTRGFHLGSDFPSCSEIADFRLQQHDGMYVAVEQAK